MEYGFTIEIDDFGSGYSSLNTLKDVPADILKLDMRFLEDNKNSKRGGNIVESVIRMAKWLGMPVIAEGVETKVQADFLRSVGCYYVQGYLYAKPMPVNEYEQLAADGKKEREMIALETVKTLDNNAFWDPKSMETLIFNSYVGGACIFEYYDGEMELLRVNEKYAKELGGDSMTMEDALSISVVDYMDKENCEIMSANICKAIESDSESVCELHLEGLGKNSSDIYVRAAIRAIAKAGSRILLYCAITNITAQREAERKERRVSEQLHAIMSNINGGVTATVINEVAPELLFVNNQYYAQLGYTKAQFAAEVKSAFDLLYPEDRERVIEETTRASLTRKPFTTAYRAIRRDGSVIWLQSSISITALPGIEEPVQLAVANDITAQREAEIRLMQSSEQLRFLNETAHDLLSQSDADKGIKGVLERVLDYFGGSRAYVFEIDYAREVINNTYEICAPGVSSEIENLHGVPFEVTRFWFRAFEQNSYISIENVDKLDESRSEERRILKEQGINSLVAVTLNRDGRLVGFIGVDDPARQQSHVSHLQAIGDYISVMLVRRDLDAKIESDNKAIIALMNDTPGGFVRMRVYEDGKIAPVYTNAGFCDIVGMTSQEVLEKYSESAMWGVHPDDMDIVQSAVEEMFATGEARSSQYRLRHGGGGYIWIRFFGRMTTDDTGETYLNIYYTDVSEEMDETKAMRENEHVLQLVAAHSSRLIYRYDIASKTAYAGSNYTAQGRGTIIEKNVPESIIEKGIVLPESVDEYRQVFREISEGKKDGGAKINMLSPDGSPCWVDLKYSLVYSDDNTPKAAVISFLDITQEHERELAYDRYLHTINRNETSSGELIYFEADITTDTTEKHGGLMLSQEITLSGHSRTEIVEKIVKSYVVREERDRCREFFSREHLITEFSDGVRTLTAEWGVVFEDREISFVRSELQMVQDPYTGHIKVYTILRDITVEKRAALDVKKQAETDGMTGIYNKSTTESLIKQRLEKADGSSCAFIIADLDNLKRINDNLGHDQGDKAIRVISELLRSQFRSTDIVGRIGGDEFAAFLDGGGGNESMLRNAMAAFKRKLSAVRVGLNGEVALGSSIGIAIGTVGTDSYEELFKKADKALYHVKRSGKNDYAIYTPDMEDSFYKHKSNSDSSWRTGYFDNDELNYLLKAVSAIYPLVISVNLTRNTYYTLRSGEYTTQKSPESGVFDELIKSGAATFHPKDQKSFSDTFSRENLLSAYTRGEKLIAHTGLQLGDDGVYRLIRTDVIFIKSEKSGDVLEITLAREVTESEEDTVHTKEKAIK